MTSPAPVSRPLLLLVAGPYRSGTGDDPAKIAANMAAMTEAALTLYRAGHMPLTGEALALPMIEAAGSTAIGDAAFNEIFHPLARRLLPRLDGVVRIGGASAGADEMVAIARACNLAVYHGIEAVPPLAETRGFA